MRSQTLLQGEVARDDLLGEVGLVPAMAVRSRSSDAPRIRTASRPALRPPPMPTVATGTPAGICTIDSRLSMPSSWSSARGTPITGSGVRPRPYREDAPLPRRRR